MPIKSDLLRSAGIGTQPNRTTKFQLLKRKAQQQKKPSFLTGLGKTLSLTAAGMKDPAAVPKIINDIKRRRMEAKLNQARMRQLQKTGGLTANQYYDKQTRLTLKEDLKNANKKIESGDITKQEAYKILLREYPDFDSQLRNYFGLERDLEDLLKQELDIKY